MRKKVSVIGAGQVGTAAAQQIVARGLADVALIDVQEGLAEGKALDLQQAAALYPSDCRVVGGGDYDLSAGSQVIVITAGLPRKPGMSRADLLAVNAEIMKKVVQQVAPRSPRAVIIVVSNPLDVMSYLAYRVSGFSPRRVVGMAGVLDAARMRVLIAAELGISVKDVSACVLGGHGDTMLPLVRYSTVAGVPVSEFLSRERIGHIVERTRNGGAQIVACLKNGSAFLAPGTAAVEMVQAVLADEGRILPCAAYLQGQYGLEDIYLGVPVRLGSGGVQEVVELELSAREKEQLHDSAAQTRRLIERLNL